MLSVKAVPSSPHYLITRKRETVSRIPSRPRRRRGIFCGIRPESR